MTQLNVKKPELLCAFDIEEREMEWLWHPYIPYGSATMMFGPGGMGKSHIACEIVAAVTNGDPLPGQIKRGVPQNVLMLSAEDDASVVLRPRLRRAGADLHRVFIPAEPFVLDSVGVKMMQEYMEDMAVTVVFIDPMVSYMGGKIDMNKMNEVRTVTGALHKAAQNTNSAVIIVHHSRKGRDGDDPNDYEKAAGSADFNNAVRSTLYVNRTNDGTKIIRHVKSNYSALGPARTFSFDNDVFEWGPEVDEETLTTMTATPRGRKPVATEGAISFIKTELAAGPVKSAQIIARASDEGINSGTLKRAKETIARSFAKRELGTLVWYWELIDGPEVSGLEDGHGADVQGRGRATERGTDAGAGSGDHAADVGDGLPRRTPADIAAEFEAAVRASEGGQ